MEGCSTKSSDKTFELLVQMQLSAGEDNREYAPSLEAMKPQSFDNVELVIKKNKINRFAWR